MTAYKIDPLSDSRWPTFLQRHAEASIFHTPGWLEALRRTYGYEPVVYTTCGLEQELMNGLLFCRVNSRLTGRRLVSLPFSDHCQPLVDNPENLKELLYALQKDGEREHWKYIEIRPLYSDQAVLKARANFKEVQEFYFHKLDLHPDLDKLFQGFHKSCVQRKIRRAEREGLIYEEGRSPELLAKFYHLFLMTRRRHQLPPQPIAWFRNLIDCLDERLKIRVVSKEGQPVASILTLFYKNSLVYKYGCSDSRFNNLGGTLQLFWQTIQEAKAQGAYEFDMGRSDCEDEGLVTFKDHWGASRSTLLYYRYPTINYDHAHSSQGRKMEIAKRIFASAPDWLMIIAGKLLYKHMG
jgi:hypothetical protein